ncbi:hypothetical protein [Undibacterium danionis]|uniref:Uncharacterized protein n=1 Tax=Undibacterium danionis TaxID=1812100 RepID=A0ABV6IE77_9BURK
MNQIKSFPMKKSVLLGSLIALSWPRTAMASGGEVLALLLLEAGLFIAVLAGLLVFRLGLKRSTIIFSLYLLSLFASIYITGQMRYLDNLILINTICIGVPLLVWIISLNYFLRQK